MDPTIAALVSALLGTVVGGVISYALNRQAHAHQLAALREEHKTMYVAEETARHFLSHKSQIDRSFDTLKKRLGGFFGRRTAEDPRQGRRDPFRKDETEWWGLLERTDQLIQRRKVRK